MPGIGIALTLHLLGVIFWVGGMGARLILLSSVKPGTGEAVRSQLYRLQRGIHLRMEVPAFLLALLPGLFLVHAAGVTFHQAWFWVKMLLLPGLILVDLLASRQFKTFNTSGQVGQAGGLFAILVVLALLMIFVAQAKF